MKGIGKESLLENININALKIAREVADATGTLMAGDICNTLVYEKNNQEAIERTKLMFKVNILINDLLIQYINLFVAIQSSKESWHFHKLRYFSFRAMDLDKRYI